MLAKKAGSADGLMASKRAVVKAATWALDFSASALGQAKRSAAVTSNMSCLLRALLFVTLRTAISVAMTGGRSVVKGALPDMSNVL